MIFWADFVTHCEFADSLKKKAFFFHQTMPVSVEILQVKTNREQEKGGGTHSATTATE